MKTNHLAHTPSPRDINVDRIACWLATFKQHFVQSVHFLATAGDVFQINKLRCILMCCLTHFFPPACVWVCHGVTQCVSSNVWAHCLIICHQASQPSDYDSESYGSRSAQVSLYRLLLHPTMPSILFYFQQCLPFCKHMDPFLSVYIVKLQASVNLDLKFHFLTTDVTHSFTAWINKTNPDRFLLSSTIYFLI